MAIYGKSVAPGASTPLYGTVVTADSINQRAAVGPVMPEHGWAYRMRIRGGRRTAVIPRVRLAIWDTLSGATPNVLLGRTGEFTTGTYMLDETDGTEYVEDLEAVVQLWSSTKYAPGFVASDAPFGYGLNATVGDGYDNTEYRKTVAAPTPQNPFAASSSAEVGFPTVSIEYEPNVAPYIPSGLSPVNGAALTTLVPTFAGDFLDDNTITAGGALEGEKLKAKQVRVYRSSDNVLIWDSGAAAASASEQTATRFTTVYGGPALAGGTTYYWNSRVQDQFNAWSGYSANYTFTVNAGQVNVAAGTPTGKQLTRTPGPFTGVWTHPSSLTTTNIQVQIRDAGTQAIVGTSAEVASAVLNNGTASLTWAQTTFSATMLQWGGTYTYAMRGKDSSGVWSAYGTGRAFTVNAAPSVPVVLSPSQGETSTSRPLIEASSTDADDSATALTLTARIKDSAGTVLYSRVMTYVGVVNGLAVWQYQTTSTDLVLTGTYRVDVYAYDGTVYSGPQTAAPGGLSAEVTFVYSTGPVVVIGSGAPTDGGTIATNAPLYDWGTTDQVRFRVYVWTYDALGRQVDVYDSGEKTTGVTAHRQPIGYLDNLTTYSWQVHVWSTLNQEGVSPIWTFSIDYALVPQITNFLASPYAAAGDVTPTAIVLSWDESTYTNAQHAEYIVTRKAVEGQVLDLDDPTTSKSVRIKRITSKSQTTFVDYLPASGIAYDYGLKQVVDVDGIELSSKYAHAEQTVTFQETVICDVVNGGTRRVVLPARKERSIPRTRDFKPVTPWSSSKQTILRTKRWSRSVTAVFQIHESVNGDVEATIRNIDLMDRDGGPLCYRDGRRRRMFGEITANTETDPEGGAVRAVELTFEQTSATEVFDV